MTSKKCKACGTTKLAAAFRKDAGSPDGLRTRCKSCMGVVETTATPRKPRTTDEMSALHEAKRKAEQLRSENKALLERLSSSKDMEDLKRRAEERIGKVKGISPREKLSSRMIEATALACASDWHIEESVRPEQVAGRNRYDLTISKARMTKFFEATRRAIDHERHWYTIRDLVLWLGGDIITNYLHPDNVETNLLSPVEAIARAHAAIADGIRFLLQDKELQRIVVPCNDGNHGRLTEKMRSAARIENSIEWLLYTQLAREFEREPRVEFMIATGEQLYLEVYGRTVRFTHGDSVRYGGGVGGVTIPIYKAMARWETVRHADLTVMGHFHQRTSLSDLIINGSLIGYSPYSLSIGARFEPPAQEFTILDSRRFKSVSLPLWVSSPEDDETMRGAA